MRKELGSVILLYRVWSLDIVSEDNFVYIGLTFVPGQALGLSLLLNQFTEFITHSGHNVLSSVYVYLWLHDWDVG